MQEVLHTVNNRLLEKLFRVRQQIGHTPLFHFSKLYSGKPVSILAKMEWMQLGGSVKSRAAYHIFQSAIVKGLISEHRMLLDATSGNTGISYAAIGKELGIGVTLCLPENASQERKDILRSLGANIVYTSRFEGTDGAQQVARELAEQHPDKFYYADQYKNDNNWKSHFFTTATEILKDAPGTTHFIAGLGTSGTFMGTARRLKEENPRIHTTSLQPDTPMHALEGWKHMETAVVPAIYDPALADAQMDISTDEAYEVLKDIYRYEGLLVSPSAAANIAGAIKLANTLESGTVVTIMADNADKYSEVIRKLL